jgi:hypothetical protein
MAEPDKRPVTMEELLVSSLAQTEHWHHLALLRKSRPRQASEPNAEVET